MQCGPCVRKGVAIDRQRIVPVTQRDPDQGTVVDRRPVPLPALTGLRFIAALAVLLTHYNRASLPPLLRTYLDYGSAGVSLFFVLSGFVLAYNYAPVFAPARRPSFTVAWTFWRARFARVYPLHILTLVLSTGVLLLLGRHEALRSLALAWIANLLLVQAWFPSLPTWNAPAWSIADEAVFYLVFPALAYFVLPRLVRLRAFVIAGIACWGAQLALFAAGRAILTTSDLERFILYQWPLFRIWEFLLGMLAGAAFLCLRAGPDGRDYRGVATRGLALALIAIIVIPAVDMALGEGGRAATGEWQIFKYEYLALTPVFVLLTLALAIGRTPLHGVLEHWVVVRLGEASYALYMLQWSFLAVFHRYDPPGAGVTLLGLVGVTIVLLGAAYLTHRYVEVPARRALRPRPLVPWTIDRKGSHLSVPQRPLSTRRRRERIRARKATP
jgi:peptidoglycan/LPS O-acetylase OafA/YrhL